MTDNVRKIFDLLGIEPNEKFKIKGDEETYHLDENLLVYGEVDGVIHINFLNNVLNGTLKIIKLPKKKKLRDLTLNDFEKWMAKYCDNGIISCRDCVFKYVNCDKHFSWVNYKDLYSDKFLDQEIEVE